MRIAARTTTYRRSSYLQTRQKRSFSKSKKNGFTLIELLVVIVILGIFLFLTFELIDPIGMQKKTRDSNRLADIASLRQAITTEAVLCASPTTAPCMGSSYPLSDNTKKIDSTGWVKVNLTNQSGTVPTLPIDPLNNASNHFTYKSDGKSWEIDAVLESEEQKDKMQNDGGNDPNIYEVGTDLTLI